MFLALYPKPVRWVQASGHHVGLETSGGVDICFLTIGFDDAVAHVHLSWCDPHKVREIVAVSSRQRLCFDDTDPRCPLSIFQRGVDSTEDRSRAAASNTMVEHMSLRDGDILYPAVVPVEPLLAQMQHFLELVAEPTTAPQSDAGLGLEVVRVLAAAERSLATGERQVLSETVPAA